MKEQRQAAAAPRNVGGRPRSASPLSAVSTRLPAKAHDRLIALANREEVSVSAMVRRLVVMQLK